MKPNRPHKTPSRRVRDGAVGFLLQQHGAFISSLAEHLKNQADTIKAQGRFLAQLSERLDRLEKGKASDAA